MRKHVVYIVSFIDRALAFEWLADALLETYEISFIFLNPKVGQTENYIKNKGIACFHISYRGKKDLVSSSIKVYKLLRQLKPDVVHSHLFDASLIGISVARIIGVRCRIYTRHHATFHHQYFPRAVYYDKIINFFSTNIVAISESVKNILVEREGVHPEKVELIPHGFNLGIFRHAEDERIQCIKAKYGISPEKWPIIGVISRYTEWKGIQFIIPAFKNILQLYPNAALLIANAKGEYFDCIKKELSSIPKSSYREVAFESDIVALYKTFDVFVHVPVDPFSEAFGQTYIEALAAKIPSVFTLSGIALEFIKHEQNALVVPYKNSKAIEESVIKILSSTQLRERLQECGFRAVESQFNFSLMVERIKEFYNEVV